MTQKDKELVFKDSSARLSYGLIVQYKGHNNIIKNKVLTGSDLDCNMEYYKPYLRPMSSMTEEEVDEFTQFDVYADGEYVMSNYDVIDWLNAHYFDYRGLIEKGLAIEVTEQNNPYR